MKLIKNNKILKNGHHIDYVSKHCKDWTPPK
jgi:hypothetical protein